MCFEAVVEFGLRLTTTPRWVAMMMTDESGSERWDILQKKKYPKNILECHKSRYEK